MRNHIPNNKRRLVNAEYVLKNLGKVSLEDSAIGFLAESSPQTTANSVRS